MPLVTLALKPRTTCADNSIQVFSIDHNVWTIRVANDRRLHLKPVLEHGLEPMKTINATNGGVVISMHKSPQLPLFVDKYARVRSNQNICV